MASPDPPFKVRAIFDYESAHDDDLNFAVGETITVTSVEDADWYYGEYTDKATGAKKQGIFPMNFVERLVVEVPARPSRARKAPEPEPVTEAPAVRAPSPVPAPVPQPIAVQPPPAPKAAAAPTYKQEEPPTPKPQPVVASSPPAPKPVKPSSPEPVKQKPPPPPPAEKSAGVASSFRDRIAAFNRQAEPVKPAAPWGAPVPKASFVKKPFVAPPPSKNAYIPPVVSHVPKPRRDEDVARDVAEPTSPTPAAEGEPPVKISSLKDRIAALQHMQLDPAGKPKPKPPKPKPRTESESSASGPTLVAEQVQVASALPEEEGEGLESVGKEPVAVRNVELEDAIQTKDTICPEQSVISARAKKSVEMRRTAAGVGDEGAESAGDADVSSSGGHDIEVPRPKAPAGKATRREHEKGDDGDDEGANDGPLESPDEEEAEKEEGEVDPEVARRLAIRERMMKMSGGIGMHGMMFGGPPGMGGMPKKKAPESRASGESERREEEQRPVPAMVPIFPMGGFGLPGMKSPALKQPEPEVQEDTDSEAEEKVASSAATGKKMSQEHADEEVVDIEDLKPSGQSKAAEAVPLPPTSPIGSPQMRPMERAPPPPPPAPQGSSQ